MLRRKRREARKRRARNISIVIIVIVLVLAAIGVIKIKNAYTHRTQEVNISVLCTGDLVMHKPVLEAAKTSEGYDFTQTFKYVQKYIEESDLAFVSLEAPLVKSNYSGYPVFRSPDKLAEDLKTVGYDTVLMSSNHTNDAGENGIFRTQEVLSQAGLKVAGSRMKAEDPRYQMTEVNGVNVAIVSYVYGDGGIDNRDLNGNVLTATARECVNTFGYDSFDEDLEEIKQVVEDARTAGADIVIMYYHWGEEYQTYSNSYQRSIAERTIKETSIDIIVGSHPHVPQEMSTFVRTTTKDKSGNVTNVSVEKGKLQAAEGEEATSVVYDEENNITKQEVPVYYAMGNLLSNQRREWMDGDRYTEQGYFVKLNISYDTNNKCLLNMDDQTIPYWLDYYGEGPSKYTLIPLDDDYLNNEFLLESGHSKLATQAKNDVEKILASGN